MHDQSLRTRRERAGIAAALLVPAGETLLITVNAPVGEYGYGIVEDEAQRDTLHVIERTEQAAISHPGSGSERVSPSERDSASTRTHASGDLPSGACSRVPCSGQHGLGRSDQPPAP